MTRKAHWLWPLRPLAPLADQMDAFITKKIAPHASKLSVVAVLSIVFLSAVNELAVEKGAAPKINGGGQLVVGVGGGFGLGKMGRLNNDRITIFE